VGPGKRFHFRAPPRAVEALAGLGIDCVTLASNDSLDFGYSALSDTLDHLSEAEISAVNAGVNVEQARAPVLLDDFIDDYALDPALRNLSLLYLVTVNERGPQRIEAVPLKLQYAHTRLADSSERAWIRDRFTSACAAFGPK